MSTNNEDCKDLNYQDKTESNDMNNSTKLDGLEEKANLKMESNNSLSKNNVIKKSISVQLNEGEDYKLKLSKINEKIKLLLEFLRKNEIPKIEYNKIVSNIEEVDKVTKLIISLTNRLNKIESILELRNNQKQQENLEQEIDLLNDSQTLINNANQSKYKQSSSTDSLLSDEKNLFSSILSLSSISLNNLNCNGTAFFASIEMLNSKKNKILDQLEEAMQLKQMIERRCNNLKDRIICKYIVKFDFENQVNHEFNLLKDFNFVNLMHDKYELSIKSIEKIDY